MSWLYLFTAGLFEIGWPVGLKGAQEPEDRLSELCWQFIRW
jgi:quaternary ammonium compound-resistance protein SugE